MINFDLLTKLLEVLPFVSIAKGTHNRRRPVLTRIVEQAIVSVVAVIAVLWVHATSLEKDVEELKKKQDIILIKIEQMYRDLYEPKGSHR